MKLFKFISFITLTLIVSCHSTIKKNNIPKVKLTTFKIDSCSIRAIEVLNDSTLFFAGSNGYFGAISSTGKLVYKKRIKFDSLYPEFRSVSKNNDDLYILSVASPALLYKISNRIPQLIYQNHSNKIFFDALKFVNKNFAIAFGDPIEKKLTAITTKDGGKSWKELNPNELYVNKGEAAFAASNTNIASYKNNIWLATGGKTSRVFYTKNFGKNWYSYSTPITQGKNTTGIYTMAFYNDKIGIIAGGDYTNKFGNLVNKAITKDGGKTWIASTSNSIPKYVSCVQYIPHEKGKKLIAVSTNGIFYSNDFGLNWIQISKQSFYTIRFVNNKLAWLAGNNKISLLKIAL